MVMSYKEASENYKNAKYAPELGEEQAPHVKKKKKKKDKRSKHKHEYIPAIYHLTYKNWNSNKAVEHVTCGSHCKHCGRVQSMRFLWAQEEARVEEFKKEYPNYVEIVLPDDWDYFKDKIVPV